MTQDTRTAATPRGVPILEMGDWVITSAGLERPADELVVTVPTLKDLVRDGRVFGLLFRSDSPDQTTAAILATFAAHGERLFKQDVGRLLRQLALVREDELLRDIAAIG